MHSPGNGRITAYMAKQQKQRSTDQTVTAISMSKDLFNDMEKARKELHMDRSNFIRYCIAKELKRGGK